MTQERESKLSILRGIRILNFLLQSQRFAKTIVGIFTLLAALLSLGRPTRATAQTVRPADLIGWWRIKSDSVPAFVLRADSAGAYFEYRATWNEQPAVTSGQWHLVADTLVFDALAVEGNDDRTTLTASFRHLLKFNGQVFTMGDPDVVDPTLDTIVRLDPATIDTLRALKPWEP